MEILRRWGDTSIYTAALVGGGFGSTGSNPNPDTLSKDFQTLFFNSLFLLEPGGSGFFPEAAQIPDIADSGHQLPRPDLSRLPAIRLVTGCDRGKYLLERLILLDSSHSKPI